MASGAVLNNNMSKCDLSMPENEVIALNSKSSNDHINNLISMGLHNDTSQEIKDKFSLENLISNDYDTVENERDFNIDNIGVSSSLQNKEDYHMNNMTRNFYDTVESKEDIHINIFTDNVSDKVESLGNVHVNTKKGIEALENETEIPEKAGNTFNKLSIDSEIAINKNNEIVLGNKEYVSKSFFELDNEALSDEINNNPSLLHACKLGDLLLVQNILENCDVNVINGANEDNWTPLHEVSMKDCQFTEILKLLLEKGALVDPIDNCQNTPLYYAVLYHCFDNIKFLVSFGADIHKKNENHITPWHVARQSADAYTKSLLLQRPYVEPLVRAEKMRRRKRKHTSIVLDVPPSPSILKVKRKQVSSEVKKVDLQSKHITINEDLNKLFEI